MSSFCVGESDYNRAILICQEWMDNYESPHNCGGLNLINSLDQITNEIPALRIKDLRPFGDLLYRLIDDELFHVMKVLLAHINNPNFILRNGKYKDKTLLQGAIASGNRELISMLLANKHGSKLFEASEPLIIDHESWLWLQILQ